MSGLTYARRMARLRARIFGGVVRKTTTQDYRVAQMFMVPRSHREVPTWYPPTTNYNSILLRLRNLGLYTDEHLDFHEKMVAQRRARGKVTPKKGQGKRAGKKKK